MSSPRPADVGAALLETLAGTVLGGTLLRASERHAGVHLVGGAVRDTLLSRAPQELDVSVEGDAPALARDLSAALAGSLVMHERFGTATIESAAGAIDIAAARSERYPEPGALPEISLGATLEQDLMRRDFTVNALAVALSPPRRGELRGAPMALDDLHARRLRTLHPASFTDDPTRLLRLARYAHRLGFTIEERTGHAAAAAIAGGALESISGPRAGAELRLVLAEGALTALHDLGALRALRSDLRPDDALVAAAQALELRGVRPDLLALAAAAPAGGDSPSALARWLDELGFPRGDRDDVLDAVANAGPLANALANVTSSSDADLLLAPRAAETRALAGARGGPSVRSRITAWDGHDRDRKLHITGDDLLAAGIAKGPEVGRRLAVARARLLDGEIAPGRDTELAAALSG